MVDFEYVNVTRLDEVPALLTGTRQASAILAGGTDLLDRLKERLIRPGRVVNIKNVEGLRGIRAGKGLEIGALTSIEAIAAHPLVREKYPVLAQAAASIATPQLRAMGTLGGNLCQRPRCWYFRGREYHCLKKGGDMCFAAEGLDKYHAIFGGGPCFIVHPSDAAPALLALGASVEIHGNKGRRTLPLQQFFVLPETRLQAENVLEDGELVTKVQVPEPVAGTRSIYLKAREKQSMDFALSSVAAVLQMQGKRVQRARLVLGGVAPIPWRVPAAEKALEGKALNEASIDKAAAAAVAGAEPMSQNGYKIHLTRNLVRRALLQLQQG